MKVVDPKHTSRAAAFELWMNAPMPMVTLFKTLDVARLLKCSRRQGYKFNLLLCWCIGMAASQIEEFYLLPVGEQLLQYDRIAVSTVVKTKGGGISTCDIPFSSDLERFREDYLRLARQVQDTGEPHSLEESSMVIGTSALVDSEIDGVVNLYAGFYNNPFLIWGKYKKKGFRTTLSISFQFHHTQMDGAQAAQFLDYVQTEIKHLKG